MSKIASTQFDHNRRTRQMWGQYAPHRRRVLDAIGLPDTRDDTLCILGAGNGNDLDLNRLTERYAKVHLVDLDDEALDHALAHQNPPYRDRIFKHGDVELTGIAHLIDDWTIDQPPTEDAIAAALNALNENHPRFEVEPCDKVVSLCVLSQLIDAIAKRLPATHEGFVPLIRALRAGHIRQLLALTKPGGKALLATDIVASDTVSDLPATHDSRLPHLIRKLVPMRNFFHGLNPNALQEAIGKDESIASMIVHTKTIPPWKWHVGQRVYLVCCFEMTRAGG